MSIPELSIEEAIADRRNLHRKQIRVQGVLSMAFEDSTLRPLGMKRRSRECERKLWVRLPQIERAKVEEFRKDFDNQLVEILGTIDADDHGHMSAHLATIKVEAIKVVPEASA